MKDPWGASSDVTKDFCGFDKQFLLLFIRGFKAKILLQIQAMMQAVSADLIVQISSFQDYSGVCRGEAAREKKSGMQIMECKELKKPRHTSLGTGDPIKIHADMDLVSQGLCPRFNTRKSPSTNASNPVE